MKQSLRIFFGIFASLLFVGAGCTTQPVENENITVPITESVEQDASAIKTGAKALSELNKKVEMEKDILEEVGTSDWVTHSNDVYGFSLMHPADWKEVEVADVETHFKHAALGNMKYYIEVYENAPASEEERDGPEMIQQQILDKQKEVENDVQSLVVNDIMVLFDIDYDRSGAVYYREAEFFVGNNYVRFSYPLLDNILGDRLLAETDEEIAEQVEQIELGEAGDGINKQIEIFDQMINTVELL